MRRQTLIALGIAVVLGLVAVFLANTYLISAERRADLSGTTRVAVAAVPLDYGAVVTRDKIRFAEFPNSSLPAGSFKNTAELFPEGQRRVALMPIQPNEPILPAKISAAGAGASIAALLPAGMRATSVRINDVSGVAGFIQPNDSVDVLITRDIQGSDTQLTDVLLQNVRVLAKGQDSKSVEGKPRLARTVTLLVDQVGAQKLALAQEVGSLSLVLRKPGEQDDPYVATVSMNDLRYRLGGQYQRPPSAIARPAMVQRAPARRVTTAQRTAPPPVIRRPHAPSGSNVEVVRGTKGDSYTVGG